MFDYAQSQEKLNAVLEKDLFFVFGYAKSGTTCVQNILQGHPEIWCGGESLFTRLQPLFKEAARRYNQDVDEMNQKRLQKDVIDYGRLTDENQIYLLIDAFGLMLSNLVKDSSITCIGDKSPEYIQFRDLFRELFPKAKFLHCIRDGRDVTVSGWFQNLRLYGDEYRKRYPDLPSYVKECAQDWRSEVLQGRAFEEVFTDQYLEIRYEDLHSDAQIHIARILTFLGVDASEEFVTACS